MSKRVKCKQFAVSYIAASKTHLSHTAAVVCAHTLGEAIDFALEQSKEKYPETEGWRGHNANGCSILGDCPLPCPRSLMFRPEGQRVDGRMPDGRSEEGEG